MPARATSSALITFAAIAIGCSREAARVTTDKSSVTQEIRVIPDTLIAARVVPTDSPAKAVQTPPTNSSPLLAPLECQPTSFGPGDTVNLRMATPHGHYLWITKVNRTSYLVVFPPEMKTLKASFSLMPSEEFAQTKAIRLPADIKAIPYVYGRDTILESVFSEAGKYLLQVGDNFGTDGGTAPPNCQLTFRPL